MILVAFVVTVGVALLLLAPSTSLAETDQGAGVSVATETPADADQPTDGEQTDAIGSATEGEPQPDTNQTEEPLDALSQPDDAAEPGAGAASEAEPADPAGEASDPEPSNGNTPIVVNGIPVTKITMRVVKVGDQPVSPVITYLAKTGDMVTLEAKTQAPAESFTMACGGILKDESVVVTDAAGNKVPVEVANIVNGAGRLITFTGVEAGTELTINVTGEVSEDDSSMRECWEGLWYTDPSPRNRFAPLADTSTGAMVGTAICHLGRPRLALVVQDKDGNDLCPGKDVAARYALQYMISSDALVQGESPWSYIVRNGGYNRELDENVEAFVLKDASGQELARYNTWSGISCKFDELGTYTLDVVRKPGATFDFTPVTIEVSLTQPTRGEMGLLFPQTMLPGSGCFEELYTPSGYQFKVNGETIPVLRPQELKAALLSMTLMGSSPDPVPAVSLPAELSSTSTAIGSFSIDLSAQQEDDPFNTNAVTMKIIKDSGKVDATTACYSDPVTWETTVDMQSVTSGGLAGLIVELRYDVNNQSYPTGTGVEPLFNYGKHPKMTLVLDNGKNVELTEGTEYTVESPDGYFEINKVYVDGKPQKVNPREYNGNWWNYWYEPLANLLETQGAPESYKPYFLHPYFQKQVLTVTYDESALDAVLDGARVKSVIVTNDGTLSEYAFTGGYGNPARALAFAPLRFKSPGPKKTTQSLEPNTDFDPPEYYLRSHGHINIGFDTTCVYTSAITVHKVDANKKDLLGAEFTLTDAEGNPTNAKAIQGQAAHLVLSHFIPGFSLLRPVPDSAQEVSRRNLTSIGEPALESTNPKGDPVGEDAYLSYAGLKEGSYIITETKAPTGYKSGQAIDLELSAELPKTIVSGYEFCRWNATVDGKPVAIVDQLADEYPSVDEDAYQFFSCNSSFIVMRVTNEPNTLSVKKVWNDSEDAQGKRPQSVKVQLYSQDGEGAEKKAFGQPVTLDASNNWSYTWEMIDEAKTWSVEEVDVPKGYTAQITGSATEGFTITNTIEPPKTSVSVKKVWDDDNDSQGMRPDGIEVQLYSQVGEGAGKLACGDPVELSASNGWTHTWSELDATKIWSVEEVNVPEGYTSKVEGNAKDGFTITNSISKKPVEGISVSVRKVWNDNRNAAHKRPISIEVQLYSQNGDDAKWVACGEPVALSDECGWSYTWKDLDKDKAWSVREVGVPKGYTAKIAGSAKDGFVITNTYPTRIPRTADETPVWAVVMLTILAAVALASSVALRRRN
jgi:hypothetical protein